MTVNTSRLLEGVTILDFSWLAAGPTGTLLLATHGAEIIRIESRRALDTYRRVLRHDGDPNKSELFASVNSGKKSVTINLKDPSAPELIGKIAAQADVVVENFSPGTLEKLHLGYDALREHRPDLVMVSCSATGHVGPLVRNAGYAPIFAALGGLVAATHTPDGRPALYGRQFDARVGVFVAIAVIAGLLRRQRSGRGGHYDVSGQEVAATMTAEATANVRAGQDLYSIDVDRDVRCIRAEDGRWVVLEVDPASRAALDRANRDPFAGLDAHTGNMPAEALAIEARSAGLLATVETTGADLLADPSFHTSGLFGEVEQPGLGRQLIIGAPIRWLAGRPGGPLGPAPLLGEDTRQVLQQIGNYSDAELDDMHKGGLLD